MDTLSLEALAFDPSKCSMLSMEEKRELVYEVSNWSDGATEILQSWSRQEILQVLCAELGKERKYTGLTKSKIIENLLKIVYEKKSKEQGVNATSETENGERTPKRLRKCDHPTSNAVVYCKNSACKAKLNGEDAFCKRCSCCICRQYDDNKDPSLWLICSSDPPFHGMSCGLSCHLECALRHENKKGLDGSFYCSSCGKLNDLLSSWRKQLVVARDTRRVDILCYRLSLCQKILANTSSYKNLYAYIDEAVSKLEEDVGPLTGLPVKKARGIVNRLSSGTQIQRLCASAMESLDFMLSRRVSDTPSDCNALAGKFLEFEEIRDSSVALKLNFDKSNLGNVVGCMIWHRKADDKEYPREPSGRLFVPDRKLVLSNLTPATEFFVKVVVLDKDREIGSREFQFRTEIPVERSESPATNCSSLSNPSSVEDENNTVLPSSNEDNYPPDKTAASDVVVVSLLDEMPSRNKDKETSTSQMVGLEGGKAEKLNEGGGGRKMISSSSRKGIDKEPQAGSSSKKTSGDKDFEYYVKVVRWLECDGHIDTAFRQKFLTWYSLRATPQEARIVRVFIDTLGEDPASLAGQLLHTFNHVIVSNKRCSTLPPGFCFKLWH